MQKLAYMRKRVGRFRLAAAEIILRLALKLAASEHILQAVGTTQNTDGAQCVLLHT